MNHSRSKLYAIPMTAEEVLVLRNALSHLLAAGERHDAIDVAAEFTPTHLGLLGDVLVKLLATLRAIERDTEGGGQ